MSIQLMLIPRSVLAAVLLLTCMGEVRAQGAVTPAPPAAAPPRADAPPYEPELLRLAEMLGALHHLRTICGPQDGAQWRTRMAQILEAEASSPERKARLAGAFNAGYQAYQRSYQRCTPAAEIVIRRFLAEGAKVAREIAARYSN